MSKQDFTLLQVVLQALFLVLSYGAFTFSLAGFTFFFTPFSSFRQLQLLERHLLTLSPSCSNTSSFSSFYKSDNLLALGCLSSCLLAHRAQRHLTLPAAQLLSSKVLILTRFSPFHEISHSITKLSPPLTAAEAAKS